MRLPNHQLERTTCPAPEEQVNIGGHKHAAGAALTSLDALIPEAVATMKATRIRGGSMRNTRAPLEGGGEGGLWVIDSEGRGGSLGQQRQQLLPDNARSFEHTVAEKQEVRVPAAALRGIWSGCAVLAGEWEEFTMMPLPHTECWRKAGARYRAVLKEVSAGNIEGKAKKERLRATGGITCSRRGSSMNCTT